MSSHKKSLYKLSPHKKSKKERDRNKLWLAGIFVIILIMSGLLYSELTQEPFVPEVTGAPRVKAEITQVDHGQVRLNNFVVSEFEIQNVGDELLVFSGNPYAQIIEGCCPPSVQMGKMELKPGEKTTVKMEYTMHEGMGGPHEIHIVLHSNDPLEPEVTLVALSDWVS